jgi:hypothetical protein
MNEHIRQLADEANFSISEDKANNWFIIQGSGHHLEKFAELIVRKCADIAKRNSGEPDPYSENYDAQVAAERKAQEIYDEIMSDFGVEQ